MNKVEHLLVCVAEECGEVAQRAHKALRFGLGEIQPGQQLTNAQRMMQEFTDLMAVLSLLHELHPLPEEYDADFALKRQKVQRYMEYAVQQGALQPESKSP